MTDTARSKYDKANELLKQLRAIDHNLNYYLDKTTPEREWMIRGALYFIEHLAKDVDADLGGIARLEE